MSVQHSALTGAELHEPKGVSGATENTAYIADGAGSGSWTDPLARINNLNVFDVADRIEDISTASSNFYLVIPRDCSLTQIRTVMDSAITDADAVISIYKNGVLQGQSLTISFSGSGAGVTDSLTLSPNISFSAGDTLELRSDGGSTDACRLACTLSFSAT